MTTLIYNKKGQCMSSKKLIIVLGLSVLFTGCTTGRYATGNLPGSHFSDTGATSMGVRYLMGRGVPQNNEKAFGYFNKAAKNDDPFAQNELAYMYAAGKGTTRDNEKAFYWYQKAADHGLASAQYNLGLLYQKGIGTPKNPALATKWFKESAAHGFEPARRALGIKQVQ